uniref:Uncharacterized protein n=1 Tax=Anguilla anguilla TaxID=7936 RepID=A0A0E9P834_ANGAN
MHSLASPVSEQNGMPRCQILNANWYHCPVNTPKHTHEINS